MRTRLVIAVFCLLPACGADAPLGNNGLADAKVSSLPGGTPAGSTGTAVHDTTIANSGPADISTKLDYFQGQLTGAAQFAKFCSYGNKDRFSAAYCASSTPPAIASLNDLLALVGMAGKFGGGTNNIDFAINTQNGSLVSRTTSVLNPRAILYDSATPFLAFGFARGDNVVEIAAQDPNSADINFFLVKYQHSCDASDTCTTGDNFATANENNWTRVDLYTGHEDLNNTPRQCDTCHRPQGFDFTAKTGSKAILRMQELVNPWTHWFRSNRGSAGLLNSFCAAHKGAYATLPNAVICGNNAPQNTGGDPANMQRNLIQNHNFDKNPDVFTFSGNNINNDSNAFVGPPPATWLTAFDNVLAGKFIHIPHYEINIFDQGKVNAAIPLVAAVEAGSMPMNAMPSLHAEDFARPEVLPIIGHAALVTNPRTNADATAVEIINQQCATCHQGVYTGSGNRELFKVSDFPANLTDLEKMRIANRICRAPTSLYLMPPTMFADLDDTAIGKILTAMGFAATCPSMTP